MQASLKKKEEYVYQNLLNKGKKIRPTFESHNLVEATDSKKTFSKSYATN